MKFLTENTSNNLNFGPKTSLTQSIIDTPGFLIFINQVNKHWISGIYV